MAHLTGFRRNYASKLSSQQNKIKRSLLQKDLEFSSVITNQQVLVKQQLQYNIHSRAFCFFFYLKISKFSEKMCILVYVFRVVSDGFVQYIPH